MKILHAVVQLNEDKNDEGQDTEYMIMTLFFASIV